MTCRTPCRREHRRASCDAFTLIELLTVIAIILVLAGLLLNVAGNANYKSSVARANAEIQAMSTALESYKADNGTYPRVSLDKSANSDALNAQSDTEPTDAKYLASGQVLYQALSGYGTVSGTTTSNKAYMDFKPGQISTGSAAATISTYVTDPFGFAYGYSTAYLAAQETANTNNTAVSTTQGYNPTFDLWSTAGYSSSGKQYARSGLASTAYNTLWAKNW